MTGGREQFLRTLVCDLADARQLLEVHERRVRLAIDNDGLNPRQLAELVVRATPGQPHRRAHLEDFLHPEQGAQDAGGGLTPEPGSAGATAETPPGGDSGVAPPSGVDEPAPSTDCTCLRGIVNGHLPHFAECELASRIAHDAGPRTPSDDFRGALE